jgi:hypothetical protein
MNIELPLPGRDLQVRTQDGAPEVYDPVRRKWVIFTPEEHVRQFLLQHLIHTIRYPIGMIAVEKSIDVGGLRKRYDIVVFDRAHTPWMLIECKRPDVAINKDVLWQVATYHNLLQCPYWLMTNGHTTYCAEVKDANCINWLPHLPLYT